MQMTQFFSVRIKNSKFSKELRNFFYHNFFGDLLLQFDDKKAEFIIFSRKEQVRKEDQKNEIALDKKKE